MSAAIPAMPLPTTARLPILVCALAALVASGTAQAQDKVVLRRGNYSGRIILGGSVEDFTGTEVVIRAAAGDQPKKYPAAEVLEIQTPQTEPHLRGVALLAEHQIDAAERELEAALKKEPRTWVRREILALLVESSLGTGNYASAGSRFLAILKSDPTTRHFRVIPLMWTPEPVSAATRTEAKAWLAGRNDAARLIGASLLFDDAEMSSAARTAMTELAGNADPRIRALSMAQGWRRGSTSGDVGELQLATREDRIRKMPEELRAGPWFLFGQACAAAHDYERAAAAYLWLPLTNDRNHRLAARACLEAGRALAKIGRKDEAITLFREVARRYEDSPSADEAHVLLEAAARSSTGETPESAPAP